MKKTVTIIFSLLLLVSLAIPALAAGETDDELPYVTDAAMILSDEELSTLEYEAGQISEQYQCGVYIITLDDFSEYVDTDSVYEAAKAIYMEYSLGWGEEQSGVLLLLSMYDRDYSLIAYGYGNTVFTDRGKDILAEAFLDNFGDDDWYEGFSDYLSKSENMFANAGEVHTPGTDTLSYVTDAAMILSDEELSTLEYKAGQISEQYQCGVYIITVDDFSEYVDTDSVYEAAKAIYREYSLGWGEEQSGVLLLLSMYDRDYSLIAYGYGNTAFTDYGKDKLSEAFLDDFGDDDWFEGFTDYLSKSASMLDAARAGKPLDVGSNPLIRLVGIVISIALGCLLAFLICGFIDKKMKSVAKKTEADTYVSAGSVVVSIRDDYFTHTTQTRVKIEKNSGGGGGTTIDSSGFSGKSGKF